SIKACKAALNAENESVNVKSFQPFVPNTLIEIGVCTSPSAKKLVCIPLPQRTIRLPEPLSLSAERAVISTGLSPSESIFSTGSIICTAYLDHDFGVNAVICLIVPKLCLSALVSANCWLYLSAEQVKI